MEISTSLQNFDTCILECCRTFMRQSCDWQNIRARLDINIVMVIHGLLTFIRSFIHEIIITPGYNSWVGNTNIVHLVKRQVFIYSHNKNKFIDCGHREMTSIIKVLYCDNIYNVAMNTIN